MSTAKADERGSVCTRRAAKCTRCLAITTWPSTCIRIPRPSTVARAKGVAVPVGDRLNRPAVKEPDAPGGRLSNDLEGALSAGVRTKIGCHSFRATGITEYLRMAASSRSHSKWLTTKVRGRRCSMTAGRIRFHSTNRTHHHLVRPRYRNEQELSRRPTRLSRHSRCLLSTKLSPCYVSRTKHKTIRLTVQPASRPRRVISLAHDSTGSIAG